MEAGGATAGAGGKDGRPLTAEEEAVKRNTDCVYFLASPLTCKKGNECEYRHSEGARVNPRDCYYWLNGNCLNPKCSFRHPPLDGPIGVPGTPLVPALPSQTKPAPQIPAPHAPASHNLNKQGVPCYFFQKGQCLKGDRCAFMHGPQPTVTPVPQPVTKISAPIAEHPWTAKKESWGLRECTKQNLLEAGMKRPVETMPLEAKPTSRTESIPTNGLTLTRSSSPYPLEDEIPRYLPANVPIGSGVAASMTRNHQSQPADERFQNGRDADEFLGESSPGFDVLVDDVIEGSDYLPKDDFGRETVQGGRSLYPVTDFNYHHSDYQSVPNLERDRFNGKDYIHYGRVHSQQSREQRTSSERIGDRILMPAKRGMNREESPDEIDRRDLRHRLSKQRRLDGSRSVTDAHRHGEPYRRDDRYVEGERYRGRHSHKDQQHVPRESSISVRFQGRIKLPARSSPERRSENERDRERHRGRLSPARSTDVQRRPHDRMKRRLHDDLATDARNLKDQPARRDEPDSLDFAGPKSLAELKGRKVSESSQGQSTRSINIGLLEQKRMKSGSQEPEGSDEFAGPKPLNDMLKRKRGAISSNRDGDNHRGESDAELPSATERRAVVEEEEGLIHEEGEVGLYTDRFSSEALEEGTTVEEKNEEGLIHEAEVGQPQAKYKVGTRMQVDRSDEFIHSPEDVEEGSHTAYSMEEPELRAVEAAEEEGSIHEAEVDQSQVKYTVEMEEGRIMGNTEDREVVSSDQRNEESDYEAFEAGDLKLEDDENMYQDYEEELDDDDDDEDDFARRVGVIIS